MSLEKVFKEMWLISWKNYQVIIDKATDVGIYFYWQFPGIIRSNDYFIDYLLLDIWIWQYVVPFYFLFLCYQVTDATHKRLFQLIVKFFTEHGIPFQENMIGFGSDGANVMFGSSSSSFI
jgi:hypothetical protein